MKALLFQFLHALLLPNYTRLSSCPTISLNTLPSATSTFTTFSLKLLGFPFHTPSLIVSLPMSWPPLWILPSSPRSTGSKARTRAVDRLRRTTHERVVAENEELGGCSICLEEFSARIELLHFGCKHLYHQNCIAKWLENQNSCPLCRRPL
ncbi:probable E3 ubiquitin-protein ligase RHA4A [Ziziphus jujuba]|uniref:RING-type E3 ubiquitin transferase n=1 Tax=Ziziphus jujuba TaxID=326968 RepID=A0ABM3IL22_ZIZJJ|nr:probable E3 ubiquitin-protein ligase RHA4A [Ziziphus jujuba]